MNKKIDFEKLVGQRIAYFRKEKKLTQYELAEIMHYSDKTISKWELGQSLPNIFVLNELAQIFDVSLDVLIGNKPIPSKNKGSKDNKFKFAFIYSLLVFTVFFIIFGVLFITEKPGLAFKPWYIILLGLASAMIPIFIYSLIYKKQWPTYISSTIFVWMTFLVLHLGLRHIDQLSNLYILYIVAIPLNLLIVSFLIYHFNFGKRKPLK